MIYEEDVKRAFSTARFVGAEDTTDRGTRYAFQGHAMNEDPFGLLCQLERTRVVVQAVFRLGEDPD